MSNACSCIIFCSFCHTFCRRMFVGVREFHVRGFLFLGTWPGLPKAILGTPPKGGIMGELDRVALTEGIDENIIRKAKRAQTSAMGQVALN